MCDPPHSKLSQPTNQGPTIIAAKTVAVDLALPFGLEPFPLIALPFP
jgi:hypothetical protein